MNKEIKDIIQKSNKQIKSDAIYNNYELQYILSNNNEITDIVYADGNKVINLDNSKIKKFKKGYSVLDEILLPELEKGKQIEFMSDNAHDYMWYIIDVYYPDDLENKKGMVKYLEYCKNNNITRKYLDEKLGSDPSDLLELYDTLHDYFKVDGLKVVMSKDVFDTRSERFYFTFVLGYDLLYKMMKKYQHLDCDSNYNFCYMIAEQFINSQYYKDNNHSAYEMLCKYVEDKMEEITKSYIDYMGIEIKITIPDKRMDER